MELFLKSVMVMDQSWMTEDLKQLCTAHDYILTVLGFFFYKRTSVFNRWPHQKTVTSLQYRRAPTFDTSSVIFFKEMHLFPWLRDALQLWNHSLERKSHCLSYTRCSFYPFCSPSIVSSQVASLVTAVYHPASNQLSPHIFIVSPELWNLLSIISMNSRQKQKEVVSE